VELDALADESRRVVAVFGCEGALGPGANHALNLIARI